MMGWLLSAEFAVGIRRVLKCGVVPFRVPAAQCGSFPRQMISTVKDKIAPSVFRRDLVRWQQLVTPTWLAALTAKEPVVAAPSDDWRLFEVGFGSSDLFASGHIPGAGYIDTNQLEQEPLWNKVSDQALLQLLLRNGIQIGRAHV